METGSNVTWKLAANSGGNFPTHRPRILWAVAGEESLEQGWHGSKLNPVATISSCSITGFAMMCAAQVFGLQHVRLRLIRAE